MSFSSKVKKELCMIKPDDFWHILAETYGLILFAKNLSKNSIEFLTENKDVADRFVEMIVKTTSSIVDVKKGLSFRNRSENLYLLSIPDIRHRTNILKLFHVDSVLSIDKKMFYNKNCMIDFLRGTFLSCGQISNPQIEYRLEFKINSKKLVNDLVQVISEIESINVNANVVKRNGTNIIYIKDNEQISDFLTLIGANKSAMEFIQVKMLKEVRNYVNRTTNFQTANIEKTAKASVLQIEAINKIKKRKGLEFLSDDLKLVSQMRLDNPELSLKELCEIFPGSISKSGLNHRLNKIIEISKNIDD